MALQLSRRKTRAPNILLWYMRLLAVYYFVAGLRHWSAIIGIGGDFAEVPIHWQAAHVYFAILELAASLGLWFGAAWGVAAWLFCAVAELVMVNFFPELFGSHAALTTFHLVTILVYVGLAWWTGTPDNTGEVMRLPEE